METEIPDDLYQAIKKEIEKMHKIYSMLGLAKKGGNISIGYDATVSALEKNKSHLVIIADDASDKTKKNIIFMLINIRLLL